MEKLQQNYNKKVQKVQTIFHCNSCDYTTSSNRDYNKHLLTRKHKTTTTNIDNGKPRYICTHCNKSYCDRSYVWRHNKICPKNKENKENNPEPDIESTLENTMVVYNENNPFVENMTNMLTRILQSHTDQNNEKITELKNMITELANKPVSIINNNNNNTANIKQKITVKMYLETECKDAMNYSEFEEKVKNSIQFSDLQYIAKHGYVEGQLKIIRENLNQLDVNMRPFHCTDLKRKTLQIKNDNVWTKEEDKVNILNKMISRIETSEHRVLCKWTDERPECYRHDSPDNTIYMDIIMQIYKGLQPIYQTRVINELLKIVSLNKLE